MPSAKTDKRANGGSGRCGRFGHTTRTAPHAFPSGAANKNYIDGRTARHADARDQARAAHLADLLQTTHAATLQNLPQLLDLTPDIAWLDVLKTLRLGELQVGASAESWQLVQTARRDIKEALHAGNQGALRAALQRLDAACEVGAAQARAQQQLEKTLERKSKLVKVRQQVLAESEHLIPAARVAAVMAGVAALVREFLPHDEARRLFAARFVGYIGQRLRPPQAVLDAHGSSSAPTGSNGHGGQ